MKSAVSNLNRPVDCVALHGIQTGKLPSGNQSPVKVIILFHGSMIHHKDLYVADNCAGPKLRIRLAFRISQKASFKNDLLFSRPLL